MNPFKKTDEFEAEITDFLKKHKTFLSNQGKRISDYFEMSCYNKLVRFYERTGFRIKVKNLVAKKFRYKLSPGGYPENFSYFEISYPSGSEQGNNIYVFEIHHNLTVQSGHQDDIYLTPDITVINKDSIISDYDHYLVENSTKKFCYVKNGDLQTFCEVKNFNPFPELLFNFIGLYNELKAPALSFNQHTEPPLHLAPSLMISGKANKHTSRIKDSLENRHTVNLLFDLFEHSVFVYGVHPNTILSMSPQLSKESPDNNTLAEVTANPFWEYDKASDDLPF